MKDEFYDLYKVIGVNVKTYRHAMKWSQDELANRCSVNRAKISRIENARKDYMLSTLLEICKALEITIDEIIRKREGIEY